MAAVTNALAPLRPTRIAGKTTAPAVPIAASGQPSVVDTDLLRHRVSLYFQVLFFIQLGFIVCCEAVTLAGIEAPVNPELARLLNVMALGLLTAFGTGWQYTRRSQLSATALQLVESLGTVVVAGIYVEAALLCGVAEGPLQGLMLVAMALMLRASLIPSPVGRTLAVGVLSLAGAYACFVHSGVALSQHVGDAILGSAFVAVSGVTSYVIYGLRREVSAARRLGQYEIKRKLGAGGMGVVYEATHVLLRRPTAIKLLPLDGIEQSNIARFEREVHQTSRLEHPNNVTIYDYGRTPDGQFYYAMEYLDGLNLEQLVEWEGPLPPARAIHILKQAAVALAEAHAMSLVHRDVKPANIMLCDRGQVPDMVKVLDFGLVKELHRPERSLTCAGKIVGTPYYLAPEAIEAADAATPATDVYALGAVAYYLLTGRPVFEGKTVISVCLQHLTETPVPPSQHLLQPLDAKLEALVLRCLAKDPAERFTDGAALAEALDELSLPGWSTADARRWWQAHPARKRASLAPDSEDPLTVDVRARLCA